jgi:hypothetical protein
MLDELDEDRLGALRHADVVITVQAAASPIAVADSRL